jgi:cholesterol transport system auxiliary component
MNRLLLVVPLVFVILSGCASRARQVEVAQYDLGAFSAAAAASAGRVAYVRTLHVKAPPWLDTPAMQYRLTTAQSTQRRAYAESRWAAPPALLVEHFLQQNLLPAAPTGECVLQVELDEFIQTFADAKSADAHSADAQSSHVEIRLRATLLPPRGGALLAGGSFVAVHDATSADAAGGVAAHAAAVRDLSVQLQSWLSRADGDPLRASTHCAPGKT